jgi:hypothetical protein
MVRLMLMTFNANANADSIRTKAKANDDSIKANAKAITKVVSSVHGAVLNVTRPAQPSGYSLWYAKAKANPNAKCNGSSIRANTKVNANAECDPPGTTERLLPVVR